MSIAYTEQEEVDWETERVLEDTMIHTERARNRETQKEREGEGRNEERES